MYFLFTRAKRNSAPPILRRGFIALALITLMTHAVGLADFWLHETTEARVMDFSNLGDNNTINGIAVDETACPGRTSGGNSCFVYQPDNPADGTAFLWGTDATGEDRTWDAFEVAANQSDSLQVLWDNDFGLAYIVDPTNYGLGIEFDAAPTYGMSGTCQLITQKCYPGDADTDDNNDGIGFNCSSDGLPLFNYGNLSASADDDFANCVKGCGMQDVVTLFDNSDVRINGANQFTPGFGTTLPIGATTNPFNVTARIMFPYWATGIQSPQYQQFVNDDSPLTTVLFVCNVTAFDVKTSFNGTDYSVVGAEPADATVASALTGPLALGYATDLVRAKILWAAGADRSPDAFEEVVAREISLQGLSLGSVVTGDSADTVKANYTGSGIVTFYNIGAVAFFIVSLLGNAVLAILVLIWASTVKTPLVAVRTKAGERMVPAVVLAHMRLTKPDAIVAEHFKDPTDKGIESTSRFVSTTVKGLWDELEEDDQQKIMVGVMDGLSYGMSLL